MKKIKKIILKNDELMKNKIKENHINKMIYAKKTKRKEEKIKLHSINNNKIIKARIICKFSPFNNYLFLGNIFNQLLSSFKPIIT